MIAANLLTALNYLSAALTFIFAAIGLFGDTRRDGQRTIFGKMAMTSFVFAGIINGLTTEEEHRKLGRCYADMRKARAH